VVLGGCAYHRGSSNVDVLDSLLPRRRFVRIRDCGSERVEVDDDDVDGIDFVFLKLGNVFWHTPSGKDSSVNGWVQRLDASVEHFGEVGDFVDGRDG